MQLTTAEECGKILTVKDGWLQCPVCRANKRLLRIAPDCRASGLAVFCRKCKTEIKIDIARGQCTRCQS